MALGLVGTVVLAAWVGGPLRTEVVRPMGELSAAAPAPLQLVEVASGEPAPDVATPVAVNLDAATAYAAGRPLVGLVVIDRLTGTYLDNGPPTHTAMGSASVIKVLLAEELLYRGSRGEHSLGASELARMESMLIASDDSAASSLYSQFGGASLIEAGLGRHGLVESSPPANPRYWGNTIITAHDVAKFYLNVLAGSISAADQEYLFGLLRSIAPVATDGFN